MKALLNTTLQFVIHFKTKYINSVVYMYARTGTKRTTIPITPAQLPIPLTAPIFFPMHYYYQLCRLLLPTPN
jgi:hypothetical protein